jgi:chromosomal replication initiation ATPase DnaA
MARQLVFDWPTGVALEDADFFVSAANATAYAMIKAPSSWPHGKLALIGPAGSGKSHLARVFAAATGAEIITAATLAEGYLPATPVVVEDADRLPADREEALFHLHNAQLSAGLPFMVTGRTPPSRWDVALPDLASRLQAMTLGRIAAPDDALLAALIMKLFADRQVMPDMRVVDYLTSRIERSFAAAAAVVAALDSAALTLGKPVTVPLARTILDKQMPAAR